MIATHNIKVNGKWYRAGEEYEVEEPQAAEEPVKAEETAVADETAAPAVEEQKASPRTRTASARRKTTVK